MSKEAMKLALEALEMYLLETNSQLQRSAVTALREALAEQPAQNRAWFTVDELNAWADKKLKENPQWAEQPAQQGPVRVPVTDNTYNYAKSLAEAIFKQHFASDEHYSSGRIVWGVNDTVIGILTQIDNMVADMVRKPAQQDSVCSNTLRAQGKAYPRTCKKCGLGPCVELAQHALDKMAKNARDIGLDYEPAQQEPVAWLELLREARDNCQASIVEEGISASRKEYRIGLEARLTATLNTSPPAQRTWVGLTDEEWQDLSDRYGLIIWGKFKQEIEAKLKEKNT